MLGMPAIQGPLNQALFWIRTGAISAVVATTSVIAKIAFEQFAFRTPLFLAKNVTLLNPVAAVSLAITLLALYKLYTILKKQVNSADADLSSTQLLVNEAEKALSS